MENIRRASLDYRRPGHLEKGVFIMLEKSLKVLEYNKIVEDLVKRAASESGVEKVQRNKAPYKYQAD